MLDEEVYWSIIESSIKGTDNQEDQELFLSTEIGKQSARNDWFSAEQINFFPIIQSFGVLL
jgi:hypothetical protein